MNPTIFWPNELPPPLRAVSARPVSPTISTPMKSGRTFVRRYFTAVPVDYKMKWIFDSEQASLFESFFKNDLIDGTLWFGMDLPLPQGHGPWTFRFDGIYAGGDMIGAPSCPKWEYSADLQLFLRAVDTPLQSS